MLLHLEALDRLYVRSNMILCSYELCTGPSSPSSSPRTNAVSSAPLLRAITEHQSMEEREAADYRLPTAISGSGEEDYGYEKLSDRVPDDGVVNSQLGWTYVDYMKAAGLDPGERKYISIILFYAADL